MKIMDIVANLLAFKFANHRGVADRELINRLLRALGRTAPTTHRSRLFSMLHNFLMYIIGIIVATFFFIQAMEMVSFIVSPNAGIVWKLLWVVFYFSGWAYSHRVVRWGGQGTSQGSARGGAVGERMRGGCCRLGTKEGGVDVGMGHAYLVPISANAVALYKDNEG
jgi:hypothetical protein